MCLVYKAVGILIYLYHTWTHCIYYNNYGIKVPNNNNNNIYVVARKRYIIYEYHPQLETNNKLGG